MTEGSPRAVQPNGIGKVTSSHLNLTRSLADVGWLDGDNPTRGTSEQRKPSYVRKTTRRYERQPHHKFAGAE